MTPPAERGGFGEEGYNYVMIRLNALPKLVFLLFIAAAVLVVLPILVLVYVWWVSESYPLVMRLAFIIALAVFYWASLRSSIRKRKEKRM